MRELVIGSLLSLTLVFVSSFLATSLLVSRQMIAPQEALRIKTDDRLPFASPVNGARTLVIQSSSLSRHVTYVWRELVIDRDLASAFLHQVSPQH